MDACLTEIIELKWLLAGRGVHLHVEQLQRDPAYVRGVLAAAAVHADAGVRAAGARLAQALARSDCLG